MNIIYKYKIEQTYSQIIKMPKDAQILTVQVQHDKPYIWAIVDNDKLLEEREFIILGTGQIISDEIIDCIKYISTFQVHGGFLVWHLFEKIKVEILRSNEAVYS